MVHATERGTVQPKHRIISFLSFSTHFALNLPFQIFNKYLPLTYKLSVIATLPKNIFLKTYRTPALVEQEAELITKVKSLNLEALYY